MTAWSFTAIVENGVIVPHGDVSLPEGTEVTIFLRDATVADRMTPVQRNGHLAVLEESDAMLNENPGDTFRGADRDHVLYA